MRGRHAARVVDAGANRAFDCIFHADDVQDTCHAAAPDDSCTRSLTAGTRWCATSMPRSHGATALPRSLQDRAS